MRLFVYAVCENASGLYMRRVFMSVLYRCSFVRDTALLNRQKEYKAFLANAALENANEIESMYQRLMQ